MITKFKQMQRVKKFIWVKIEERGFVNNKNEKNIHKRV